MRYSITTYIFLYIFRPTFFREALNVFVRKDFNPQDYRRDKEGVEKKEQVVEK